MLILLLFRITKLVDSMGCPTTSIAVQPNFFPNISTTDSNCDDWVHHKVTFFYSGNQQKVGTTASGKRSPPTTSAAHRYLGVKVSLV